MDICTQRQTAVGSGSGTVVFHERPITQVHRTKRNTHLVAAALLLPLDTPATAALISASVAIYHPDFLLNDWQVLLVFYAICLLTLVICALCNSYLPMIDTICAAWTAISIVVILIALSVSAAVGRHSAAYSLGNYDTSLSGYGGFTFFIGLLPAAYTFSAIGMISSMAEECNDPAVRVPKAISLCIPVGGIAGLFFIIPTPLSRKHISSSSSR